MSTEETIRTQICRHNPDGHLLPMQWLIHNPAFSGTKNEWTWGEKKHARTFALHEVDLIARKQGGWHVILGTSEAIRHLQHPVSLRVASDEVARLARAKPNSERTIAERVALSRLRRRTMRPKKRPFTASKFNQG